MCVNASIETEKHATGTPRAGPHQKGKALHTTADKQKGWPYTTDQLHQKGSRHACECIRRATHVDGTALRRCDENAWHPIALHQEDVSSRWSYTKMGLHRHVVARRWCCNTKGLDQDCVAPQWRFTETAFHTMALDKEGATPRLRESQKRYKKKASR